MTRRSSLSDNDWFVQHRTPRLERLEAFFGGHAFDPHRHDTYAIGITLTGVQSFHYRGVHRHSLPGHAIVIHPDEVHDGHAGAASGFRYRMLYVPPSVLQDMLGGQPLPFVPGGITGDPRMTHLAGQLLRHIDSQAEPFEEDDALFGLATIMSELAGQPPRRGAFDYPATQRARAFMDSASQTSVTLADLEAASGQNRWRLSRDFRALFGTSPYRYLTMRRLERLKQCLREGQPLAEAALNIGFSDQSHMTRQFHDAFGIGPGRWVRLINTARQAHGKLPLE